MARYYKDWLAAYMEYASFSEAPPYMHFWAGASAIAGALRRKVWIDQAYFRWYPNMYVVFVAPPGIVSKSTTTSVAMKLLRKVPGVQFGPDIVTMPSLISTLADSEEGFNYPGGTGVMSAITLESSEFGNLLDPRNKQMVDAFVSLWDGKEGSFVKETKHSGNDEIKNPWVNLIACTTPAWIAENFPEYMVGGGFVSRCLFVYGEKKHKYVPYPGLVAPANMEETAAKLVSDLVQISNLAGEYRLTDDAVAFGAQWYEEHYKKHASGLAANRAGGYVARKQTHIHKLAMILAAATSDTLIITADNLKDSLHMISDLEPDMAKVFKAIGQGEDANVADRLLAVVQAAGEKGISVQQVYRILHAIVPSAREFEDLLMGCVESGQIKMTNGVLFYCK